MHGTIIQTRIPPIQSPAARTPRPLRKTPRRPAPDPRPDPSAGLLSPAEIRALVREWLG